MKLEPVDISIHVGIAVVATALIGWFTWPFAVAAVVSLVFFVREGIQQTKTNNPPKAWEVWKWGPRGLSEAIAPAVAAFITAGVVQWLS